MPKFQDPISDADGACEALRALAHATRRFSDPAQTYDVIGNLLSAVRSLQQVLDQVASAHLEHQDRAFTDSGDSVAGASHADRAANAIHDAAQQLGYVEKSLDLASQHSGRITWHPAVAPGTRLRSGIDAQFGADIETAPPVTRISRAFPQRKLSS